MAERMKDMSPEEKEKFLARMERRKQMYEKIKDMNPDERKVFREARIAEKMKGMTPEEKEEFKQRMEERKKRYAKRRAERGDIEESDAEESSE
jgi:uncharacterized protein YwgA